jgi:hypothetical protein
MRVAFTRQRHLIIWPCLIAVVVLLGLGSRRYAAHLPGFVSAYAGDTLWALAAFLGLGLLLPRAPTRRVAILAMSLSVAVEVNQLYHAPWIDSIRRTTLGGLILGYDFVWSDLACYAVGVGLGVLIERGLGIRKLPLADECRKGGGDLTVPDGTAFAAPSHPTNDPRRSEPCR